MMGNLLNLTVWFVSVGMLSLISTENVVASSSLEGLAGNSEGATECGIQMFVPKMLNIYGQPLRLECRGSDVINGGVYRVARVDYQYDPNNRRTGDSLGFYVGGVGISKSKGDLINYFFDMDGKKVVDNNSNMMVVRSDRTYCGLRVTTVVSAIRGVNWKGWLAEDKYSGKIARGCDSPVEYTHRYRCISMIFGNESASAAMGKACLLREPSSSLQRGLSYDIFMSMVKTINLSDKK